MERMVVVSRTFAIFLLLTLGLSQSYADTGDNLMGQLNIISHNESIEIFYMTQDYVSSVFSAPLELRVRPPCPSCHPSYNYVLFGDQLLIPSTEVVTVFTFLDEEPYVYTQALSLTNCEPLSLVKHSLSANLLFIDCQDLENGGNYFLAELERSLDTNGPQLWTFERTGFENFEQVGTFVEVTAFDSVMMLYVYEAGEYIMMRGLISGYVNVLPHNCGHIVRMTATGSKNELLLECSHTVSELVNSLHIYELDSITITHLINTPSYTICPIRFTQDGRLAAIFTDDYIIVIDLESGVFANISVNQLIYDGVITHSVANNSSYYVVYSTTSGLYRVLLTQQLNGMGTTIKLHTISLFPNTIAICASHGCPLLNLVDNDIIMIGLNYNEIMTFSISSLEMIAQNVKSEYQPSRIVFTRKNVSNLILPPSPEPYYTIMTTIKEPIITHCVLEDFVSEDRLSKATVSSITVVGVVVLLVVVVIVCVVVIVLVRRRRSRSYKPEASSSDEAKLINDDDSISLTSQSNESDMIEMKTNDENVVEKGLNKQQIGCIQQITDYKISDEQTENRGLKKHTKMGDKGLNRHGAEDNGTDQQQLIERDKTTRSLQQDQQNGGRKTTQKLIRYHQYSILLQNQSV